jgi:hypothetical protein
MIQFVSHETAQNLFAVDELVAEEIPPRRR